MSSNKNSDYLVTIDTSRPTTLHLPNYKAQLDEVNEKLEKIFTILNELQNRR